MAKPVKGSNIGSVTPFVINSGNGIMSKRPDFTENLQNIISNGAPNITSGIGTNINVTPQGSAIGLSEVPSTGLPNLTLDSVSELMQTKKGLGQSILDAILIPERQKEFGEFIDTIVSPNELQLQEMERRRQSKVKSDLMIGDDDSVAGGIDDAILASSIKTRADFPRREAGIFETEDQNNSTDTQVVSGSGVSPTAAGESTGKSTNVPGADTPAKKAAVSALDEYLKSARPGVSPKDYPEYMKEFAEATGLDVSGQPDNSTALMAFGLALMQNKAGKGFDVGNILSSVGEAGQTALPELTKARSEARALRAKAGEFAISRKREDQAAARNRQQIFVVPRTGQGKTETERLQNRLMQGRYIPVNSYEFDALVNAEGFDENYEVMPGDVLGKMGDLFKGPESRYMDKPETITLFEDKNGKIDVRVRLPKAGSENLPSKLASSDQAETAISQLNASRDRLDQTESRFTEFAKSFSESPPNAIPQAINSVIQLTSALGFLPIKNFETAVKGENDIQKQKRFLEWVSTSYAPEILQESGKTISDADRERVNRLVGEIKMLQDPRLVAARVNQLHTLIIKSSRAKLSEGYRRLNQFGAGAASPTLNEDQRKELDQLRSEVDSLLSGSNQT